MGPRPDLILRKHCYWVILMFFLLPSVQSLPGASADGFPPINEIRHALQNNLHVTPDYEFLQDLKANGLDKRLREIDQHARLFSPEEYRPPSINEHGLAGIGADLFFREGKAFLTPYQGGPMVRAGIEQRVELREVDGVSTLDIAPDIIAQSLMGDVGSFVDLTLACMGQSEAFGVRLQRDKFTPMNIELLQRDSADVLRIRLFRAGITSAALSASIDYIRPENQPIFIDLRESTGGDIYEAFDCAALFLPEGAKLGGLQLQNEKETFFFSRQVRKFPGPLILLIGPDTASAAEAFAAALSYHGQVLLVGRPTYGKCSTQTDVRLSGGWVLRLTNGLVLGPDGSSCRGNGLQPDILVEEKELYNLDSLINRGWDAIHK
jgi:carboxyl-terminal processing protease